MKHIHIYSDYKKKRNSLVVVRAQYKFLSISFHDPLAPIIYNL